MQVSPVVGLACFVAPVESLHFPFGIQPLIQVRPGKEAFCHQPSLVSSGGGLEKRITWAAQQHFTHLPDVIEVEHKPVAFCEELSFITGFLQQDNQAPTF